jgi:tetratricopeptide (TPR) repeat protein
MAERKNNSDGPARPSIGTAGEAALIRLGQTYLEQGRLVQARVVFAGITELFDRNPYVLAALGSISQQEGKLEEALDWYGRALEADPADVHTLANRGEIRLGLGRLAEAAADFQRAIAQDPGSCHPAANRARLLAALSQEALELAHEKGRGAVLDAQRRIEEQLQQ